MDAEHQDKFKGQNPTTPPDPTQQLEDETDAAYVAFQIWLDLPDPERTTRTAAAIRYTGSKDGVTNTAQVQRLRNWSSLNNWAERLRAYKADQDRARRDAEREAAALMGSRQAREAMSLQDVLMIPVREVVRRLGLEDSDMVAAVQEMDPKELLEMSRLMARPLATAVSTERIARGEPISISRRAAEIHIEAQVTETEGRGQMMGRMLDDPDAAGAITLLTGRGGMQERRAARRAQLAEAGSEDDPNAAFDSVAKAE